MLHLITRLETYYQFVAYHLERQLKQQDMPDVFEI